MGAFGIDADAFSHRAIAKGAPGYPQVIETFGRWVVGPDGEIDRAKLGRLVFSDPAALAQLEAIIHPLVLQAVDWMVQRSNKPVVVIEAIKLLEVEPAQGLRQHLGGVRPARGSACAADAKARDERGGSSPAHRGSAAAGAKDGRGKCGDPQYRLI